MWLLKHPQKFYSGKLPNLFVARDINIVYHTWSMQENV